jgi:hypothetical protein
MDWNRIGPDIIPSSFNSLTFKSIAGRARAGIAGAGQMVVSLAHFAVSMPLSVL